MYTPRVHMTRFTDENCRMRKKTNAVRDTCGEWTGQVCVYRNDFRRKNRWFGIEKRVRITELFICFGSKERVLKDALFCCLWD